MRPIRPVAIALVLAAVAGTAVAAPHGGPRDPGVRLDRLAERLELTETQRAEVRAILGDARRAGRDDRAERRAAVHEALAGVLSEEQLAAFEALHAERRPPRHGPPGGRGEGRFEHLAERLELRESQRAPVREILGDARSRSMAAIRGARVGDADRAAVRAELEAVRAETRAALAGILTPAQLETFDALEKERRRPPRP